MVYLLGFFGFCAGFYAGLMMLKPALRRYSNRDLVSDKALARKVGWIPWAMALLGLALGIYGYDWFLWNA
jgi:hypothetical protein